MPNVVPITFKGRIKQPNTRPGSPTIYHIHDYHDIEVTLSETVALGQPTLGELELKAIADVFATGWIAGNGPTSRRFEEAFSNLCQTEYALGVSNCTAGLHLAFHALGAGEGDEVLVADYTFPATGHAVMHSGATPVFVDVRADTWTMDAEAASAAITPRTVGIVAVDAFGQPADYDELEVLARRHSLWLVEDAAAAAGATYKGRPAGQFGDAAAFSFHGRKGISSGEGGALTTNNDEIDASARKLHAFGISSAHSRASSEDLPVPEFDELGFNYKMSDIAAAIMLAQLERLPDLVERRNQVAARYGEALGGQEFIQVPHVGPDRTHVWQSYVLTLDPSLDRAAVARYLRRQGIQCTIGTYASHRQPLYGFRQRCPVSSTIFDRHLAIPMHANLTDGQVDRVADTVLTAISATLASGSSGAQE